MEIIANPRSGKDNGIIALKKVQSYLNNRNIPHTIHITNKSGHAKELAQELSEKGAKKIVALGGDGTFHEVLNGIDFNKSSLGFIPAGRGNDFAKSSKISLNTEEALEAIIRGNPETYDYIQIGDLRCLNVAGTGLDVDVLKYTANRNNKITYAGSLLKCLLNYKPYTIQVELDGQTKEYSCVMAGLCNGNQFGGGLKLCPPAKPDDGKLDLVVIEKPPRVPTFFLIPCFAKGNHMQKTFVKHFLCDKVKITTPAPIQLDGEIYYNQSFDAQIVTGGVKTFAQL